MKTPAARRVLQGAITVMMLGWPIIIWQAIRHNSLQWVLPILICLLLTRLACGREKQDQEKRMLYSVSLVGIALCLASYLLHTYALVLWYPVAINVTLLSLFGASLWRGIPLVERLARLRNNTLPPAAVRYTRRVTQIWCLFFMINGTIAALTCLYGDIQWWTLWNGMIAYLLMGTLMAGEWIVRQWVIKRTEE